MLAPALAAFALSSALNPHFLLAAAAPLYERQASLASCLRRNGLQPITAQSSNFTQDTEAYNERLQPNPAALFYPSSPDDIASALTCAASTSTQVSARGGGHSYASYSLGGDDGALVVDLNAFRDISVDENGLAKIGAGNRLGDIYLALNEEGWAFAAGTCPGVGIGGHAGFGGFGLSSRMWGFASDQVVGSYDVVLANGTVLTNLTRESNEDLFWGLNGAAPNFGVVTSYYLQAHHAPVNAVVFSYTYTSPSTTIAATALHSYEQFANLSAPANLGMITNIGVDTLSVTGVWYGPRAEFDQVIQPLKDELPPSFDESVQEKDWIGAQAQLAGDPLDTQGKMLQSRDTFYAKSLMTPSTIPIDITVWESFLDYLWQSNTSTNWFVEIDTYGGQNSEINVRGLNESSFGHRDKLLTFQLYASSPTYGLPWVDEGTSFVQGMFDTIVDGMTSASPAWSTDSTSPDGYAAYVNYVDPNLSFDDVKNLYWGSQYDRLAQLKAEYDPEQVLHNPQSIQPANSTDA